MFEIYIKETIVVVVMIIIRVVVYGITGLGRLWLTLFFLL